MLTCEAEVFVAVRQRPLHTLYIIYIFPSYNAMRSILESDSADPSGYQF